MLSAVPGFERRSKGQDTGECQFRSGICEEPSMTACVVACNSCVLLCVKEICPLMLTTN